MILIYLSSGLFLGWSLGANNAANVFGPAVGTKMIKFKTAAYITCIFVILGAVLEGAGASQTLGKLGSINQIAGAFTIALSSAVTVTLMTKAGLPVSTSQAIVGGIIGWNFFAGMLTDYRSLTKIFGTWIVCPILSAIFSFILFKIFVLVLKKSKTHLLLRDAYTRIAFIVVGAFGAYSLGANNIANAVGVFASVSPFKNVTLFSFFTMTGIQQLFLLGSIAIGVGVITYSYKVMKTVGGDLFKLSPIAGLIVVLAESLVLFLFGSKALHDWLLSHGLPTIPLVPVSSSQAVVGGVLGIALAKGGRNIQFGVLGKISVGWILTPIIAGIFAFFSLFVVQNVFNQPVFTETRFFFNEQSLQRIHEAGIEIDLENLKDADFQNEKQLRKYLRTNFSLSRIEMEKIHEMGNVIDIRIPENIRKSTLRRFSKKNQQIVKSLSGSKFLYKWQLTDDLYKHIKPDKISNEKVKPLIHKIIEVFSN